MGGVLPDRAAAQPGRRVEPIDAHDEPGELDRRELGNLALGRLMLLRASIGRKRRSARAESRDRGTAQQRLEKTRRRMGFLANFDIGTLWLP